MSLFMSLTLLSVIVGAAYAYVKHRFRYWKDRGAEYLKPSFPLGNIGDLLTGRRGYNYGIMDWYEQTKGPYSGLFMGFAPAVLFKDPDLIRNVMVKDFYHFMDRGIYLDEKKEPRAAQLFRQTGMRWKNLRAKLSPAFTLNKLKMMFGTIVDVAKELENHLELMVKDEESVVMDASDVSLRYSIDIIASVIFGVDNNSFTQKDNKIFTMAEKMFRISFYRMVKSQLMIFFPTLLAWSNAKTVEQDQQEFIHDIVTRVIEHREKHKLIRNDMMQMFIQLKNIGEVSEERSDQKNSYANGKNIVAVDNDGTKLTVDELTGLAYTFWFAGFETTSSTIQFCLYELTKETEVQEKAQEEIDRIMEKYDNEITYESVSEMEYLDKVVAETLRKYPTLSYLTRVCTKEYNIPDTDIVIEEGTKAFLSILGLHYDPLYYPDPEKFDPERFSPENRTKIHPYAYLPFGEGPRNCVAKKMGSYLVMAALVVILRKYSVEKCAETEEELELDTLAYTLKTKRPIKVKLVQRKFCTRL